MYSKSKFWEPYSDFIKFRNDYSLILYIISWEFILTVAHDVKASTLSRFLKFLSFLAETPPRRCAIFFL